MIDFSTPLQGMQDAVSKVNRTASKLAQAGSAGDQVDLSAEMVALLAARTQFVAQVKVAQTADAVNRSLVNLLG